MIPYSYSIAGYCREWLKEASFEGIPHPRACYTDHRISRKIVSRMLEIRVIRAKIIVREINRLYNYAALCNVREHFAAIIIANAIRQGEFNTARVITSCLAIVQVGKIVSRPTSVVVIFTMAISTESYRQHSVIMMVLVSGLCKCVIMFVMRYCSIVH